MRSAWICTRNDVLGNLAVLLAAAGVFGTGTGWPDIIVAAIMAGLALQGAWIVVRQSLRVRFETHTDRARRRTRSMTEAA
jgi:Co/Zn/Cd efflux system component